MSLELDIGERTKQAFLYNTTTGMIHKFWDFESLIRVFTDYYNCSIQEKITEQELLDFWFNNCMEHMDDLFFKNEITKIKECFK